jgi:hypothetical protein
MAELAAEIADGWHRAELRQYNKKAKTQTQLPQIEPVPLTIEEGLPQGQDDRPEAIKA